MVFQRWRQMKRMFNTRKKKPHGSEAPPPDFKELEQIINGITFNLFKRYRTELLNHSPLYLVSVVWGEKAESQDELDAPQREMHRTLAPFLEDLEKLFSKRDADTNGTSGLEYLLKGLILYKMAYMVQYYMNKNGYAAPLSMEEASLRLPLARAAPGAGGCSQKGGPPGPGSAGSRPGGLQGLEGLVQAVRRTPSFFGIA